MSNEVYAEFHQLIQSLEEKLPTKYCYFVDKPSCIPYAIEEHCRVLFRPDWSNADTFTICMGLNSSGTYDARHLWFLGELNRHKGVSIETEVRSVSYKSSDPLCVIGIPLEHVATYLNRPIL